MAQSLSLFWFPRSTELGYSQGILALAVYLPGMSGGGDGDMYPSAYSRGLLGSLCGKRETGNLLGG